MLGFILYGTRSYFRTLVCITMIRMIIHLKNLVLVPLCLGAFFISIESAQAVGVVNTDDLISHWSFDEGSGDEAEDSASGYYARLRDGNTMWTNGVLGGGIAARDAQGYASTTGLYPTGDASRTINLWFKHDTGVLNENGHGEHIMNYGSSVANQSFGVMMFTGGTWWFYGHNEFVDMDTGVAADDQWHMHTVTYDGDIVAYYLDGIEVASTTRSLNTVSSNMYFGNRMDPNPSNIANGIIDEATIWEAALSDEEIEYLYNEGQPTEYPFFAVPTITTQAATEITSTGATLNGELDLGAYAQEDIGTLIEIGFFINDDADVSFENGGQGFAYETLDLPHFSLEIDDLECETTYYFSASGGYVIGDMAMSKTGLDVLSFTTLACDRGATELPTITTLPATDITQTGANMQGEVEDTGGQDVVPYGFHINRTSSVPGVYEDEASDVSVPQGVGAFSMGGDMFECGTTYYYRAYGTNDAGTAYGEEETFSTLACDEGEVISYSSGGNGRSISLKDNKSDEDEADLIQLLEKRIEALKSTLKELQERLTPGADTSWIISYGDQGDNVRILQTLLISQGFSIPAGATGLFADQTLAALKAYQTTHDLIVTGILDTATQTQMKQANLPGIWW